TDPVCTSTDGRYIAFVSFASDLTATPDTNNVTDVFVRDRVAKTTKLVTANAAGTDTATDAYVRDTIAAQTALASVNVSGTTAAGGNSAWISGDGRFVTFLSAGT